MKIAIVHSFYDASAPSGENQAVLDQFKSLKNFGHDVKLFSQTTPSTHQSWGYKIRAWFRVSTGRGQNPERAIRKFGPDLVHVHNLFPNYSTSWLSKIEIPVILSIHNYRPMCAAGTFFREGNSCFECLDSGNSLPALKHKCYRSSVLATAPLALANRNLNRSVPLAENVEKVLVLTDSARDLYLRAKWPASKLHVIPNFLPESSIKRSNRSLMETENRWVYAGRFSPEKGVIKLIRDWPEGEELIAIGDGPLFEQASRISATKRNVRVQKSVSHDQLMDLLRNSKGLVFPSLTPEGLPLVVIEALAHGCAILAKTSNSVATLVQKYDVGLVYSDAKELSDSIKEVCSRLEAVKTRSRQVFKDEFSEEKWLTEINSVYSEVLQ